MESKLDISEIGINNILLIDNDIEFASSITSHLEDAGYNAYSLTDSMNFNDIDIHKYPLALVGIKVNDDNRNDLDLVKYIRSNSLFTTVIIISEQVNDSIAENINQIGGCDILLKPFNIDILLFKIRSIFKIKKAMEDLKSATEMVAKSSEELAKSSDAIVLKLKEYKDLIDNIEKDHIIKFLHFDENSYQAGISILSYFSTVIYHKFPHSKVKIRIEQEDRIVRLLVETPDGEKEKYEKTLEEYGLVVTGEMQPEDLFTNPLQVMQLRHKLEMTALELVHTRDLLSVAKTSYDNELIELKKQIGEALRREDNSYTVLYKLIESYSLNGPVKEAYILLVKHLEDGVVERDKEIIMELIKSIKTNNPLAFEAIKMYIINTLGGASGSLISGWISTLYAAMPK